MGDKSAIEWTDATWNPVRGCVKVSPGCKHCYAETFAERFRGVAGHAYERGFDPRLAPETLDQPIRWERPRRIFVNSMSDLFQEVVPDQYIAACFGVMALACHHTYQVLTKRARRMRDVLRMLGQLGAVDHCLDATLEHAISLPLRKRKAIAAVLPPGSPFLRGNAEPLWPLPNVHMGVSVEDRKHGVPRIDVLRETPAEVRFLSIEPLIEDLGTLDLKGIQQVIVGAERAKRARPMHDDWVRSIRDQAKAAGAAFFYKQQVQGREMVSLPMLDGRQWAEQPGDTHD